MLAWLTLLSVDEIDDIVAAHEATPERREAQRRLAWEVTAVVHGREPADAAERGTKAFTNGIEPDVLRGLEGSMPTTNLTPSELPSAVVDLLVRTELASSKSAAARLIAQGGAYVNDQPVAAPEATVGADAFVDGRWVLLRAGKRHRHLLVLDDAGS
jgi:tyrosyl-tRNA synthetase